MTQEKFLTVQQAAEQLQVGQETIRRWLKLGKLKGSMLGGKRSGYRIPESEVIRAMREGMPS